MCDRRRRNPGRESRRGREHAFRRLQPASCLFQAGSGGRGALRDKMRSNQKLADLVRRSKTRRLHKLLDRRSGCEFSHERLARADKLYDLFVVVGYNWPNPVPNRGAVIFIHAWRSPRHPTAGCVAFDASDLDWIIRRLSYRSRLIVLPETHLSPRIADPSSCSSRRQLP